MHSNIIAVATRKGGTAKTTTTATLAAIFAEDGRRVLVIDFDPQGSLSAWYRPTREGPALFDALAGSARLAECVHPTAVPGVSIVPADPRLAGLDRALSDEVGPERVFAERLADLPAEIADLVLIDCGPTLGLQTLAALVAARYVVVPVTPDALGGAGLRDSVALIDSVRKRMNRRLELAGVLVCRADHRRNLTAEAIAAMRRDYGRAILEAIIPESAAAAEAPSHGLPLTVYDSGGKATAAYRGAAAEILKRTKRRA